MDEKMTIDKSLKDVQLALLNLANAIQTIREKRLRQTPTLRQRKDKALLETTQKINKIFLELGYETPK
jgi:hypothetical protein